MDGKTWLVDGMNLIGSRPNGWWKDPDNAKRGLVDQLTRLAMVDGIVCVVFDGTPLEDLPEGMHEGVKVFYAARNGPNAADERIRALVARDLGRYRVVTSDRQLREQIASHGVEVTGVSRFWERLDAIPAEPQGDETAR